MGGGRSAGRAEHDLSLKKPFRELSTSPATSATGMPPGGRRYLARRMKCSASAGFARLESHLAHLLNSHTLGNRNRRHGGDLLARKLDDILLNHAGARERRLHAWRSWGAGLGGLFSVVLRTKACTLHAYQVQSGANDSAPRTRPRRCDASSGRGLSGTNFRLFQLKTLKPSRSRCRHLGHGRERAPSLRRTATPPVTRAQVACAEIANDILTNLVVASREARLRMVSPRWPPLDKVAFFFAFPGAGRTPACARDTGRLRYGRTNPKREKKR